MSDFVIFLDAEWDDQEKRNRQHFLVAELARQLEDRTKILGVERPIYLLSGLFLRREKFIKWMRGECGLYSVSSNFYIYTPFILIHNLIAARVPLVTRINRYMMKQLLKRVLRRLDFNNENIIAWIHHPFQLEDIGVVGEKFLVYDCYDDYINRPRISEMFKNELAKRERTVLNLADVVIVSSEVLLNEKKNFCKQAIVVPNATEARHFQPVMNKNLQVSDEIKNISKPRLGYVGSLHPRLDFLLLLKMARRHPEWSIILIGPKMNNLPEKDLGYLKKQPNIHFLGSVRYSKLPQYYKGLDVCLIPFKKEDPTIQASSPMKIYEYLATGKSIVSVDFPAVRPFKKIVRIAHNIEEFEQQVSSVLKELDVDLRQKRLIAAGENSWESRVGAILKYITKSLQMRLY